MAPTSPEFRADEVRGIPRTSLYLAASLYCDGSSSLVKIRNISAAGALVEGAVVPRQDALVQLVRGGLIVHGLVAWSGEGRCGLKFSGCIDVDRWRATPCNSEQRRVDEVVRLVKAGAVPLPVPPLLHAGEQDGPDLDEPLSEDLRRACRLLENLGEMLADDMEVVTRHGPALQNLDIAGQLIAAVEAIVAGRDDRDGTKLSGLRRSADQALKRGG